MVKLQVEATFNVQLDVQSDSVFFVQERKLTPEDTSCVKHTVTLRYNSGCSFPGAVQSVAPNANKSDRGGMDTQWTIVLGGL